MADTRPIDPYKNFEFLVEIDGIIQAGFSECSGFGSEMEVIEYREGGDDITVRKLPGKVSYPDITLRWGLTDSHELYDWHKTAINGNVERKNGSIIQLNDVGEEVVRWNFYNAWASQWNGPDFDASGSDVSIENLTIVTERLEQAT